MKPRIAIGFGSQADIPEWILSKISSINKVYIHKGVPEFDFPLDFWEYFDKQKRRLTNYPDIQPIRWGRFYGYTGYDFDEPIKTKALSFFMQILESDKKLYWRPSSNNRGIHVLVPDNQFLNDFEDHVRQEFTQARGFEWFWLSKSNYDEHVKNPHILHINNDGEYFIETRYYPFKEMTRLDVMRLFNFEKRRFRHTMSRKKTKRRMINECTR